ncbi:MAG: heme exporter protein CcmD [Methyloligellaceae bacterium]
MSSLLDLGQHAGFIWAAYGAAALVLACLIAWIHYDARRQRQLLADLEAMGIRRRSARSAPGKSATQGKKKSP